MSDPVAFFTYAHGDDYDGRLTRLREAIANECRMHIGRPFAIFQDRADIRWGQMWRDRIEQGIAASTFLFPILSPSFFQSPECRREVEAFAAVEARRGRNDLMLPILYLQVPELKDPRKVAGDSLLRVFAERQHVDWQKLRIRDLESEAVKEALDRLGASVRSVLDDLQESAPSLSSVGPAAQAAPDQPRSPQLPVRTRWEGQWIGSEGQRGHVFDFVMHLKFTPAGDASGYILWRLVSAPPLSPISNRINESANEFVRGKVHSDGLGVTVDGYEVDDPLLIGTSAYDIRLDSPAQGAASRFRGDSRDADGWNGNLTGIMTIQTG